MLHGRRAETSFAPITALVLICCVLARADAQEGGMVTVKPKEIGDVLVNPGMGWTTFHSYNGDPNNEKYPQSSIAYFRYYWDEIEPQPGQYRWDIIDGHLQRARERGQEFAFRVMPCNGVPKCPRWLRDMGCKGKEFNGGKSWQPDYSDPLYLKHQGALVAELGKRYDGHPDIAHVDLGSLGRWGEWHTSGTGMDMPPWETRKQIIDWYLAAFKKTPLVMLIGDAQGLEYAVEHGTGWRADCLGDMGGFSKTWNHMDFYPQQLEKAKATEAWKTAPVCFETCWTMKFWKDQGWDVEWIFEQALNMHISVLNNKSSPIPDEWWPAVERLSKRMGYRLVLREMMHSAAVAPGSNLELRMTWENIGVAPCYKRYPLMVELQSTSGTASWQTELEADLTKWLPGRHAVDENVAIPQDLPPGRYALRIAFVDPTTHKPRLKLAIAGVDGEGWYPVSELRIAAP